MGDAHLARLRQADPFVNEYIALIDEGWSPNLEEFLHRVPEELREEVFEKIDRALANRQADAEAQFMDPRTEEAPQRIVIPVPPPEAGTVTRNIETLRAGEKIEIRDLDKKVEAGPQHEEEKAQHDMAEIQTPEPATPAEPSLELPKRVTHTPSTAKAPSDFIVAAVTLLMPGGIRQQFRAELLAGRKDMRDLGMPGFEIRLYTFHQLLIGLAQHAPLQRSRAEDGWANNRTFYGWLAWRFVGPALLLSFLTGSLWFVALGVVCMAGAIGALLLAVHRDHLDEGTTRLINAVMGGCLVTILLSVLFGLGAGVFVVIGGALGLTWLPVFAAKAMMFLTAATACVVTGTGWTPEAWVPKRRDVKKG